VREEVRWFKRCVEMPEKRTKLFNWQMNQLGNGAASLKAKIRKEIEENEGSTIWSEWRVELCDRVEQQKNHAKIGNAWEEKYNEFESYNGMPEKRTKLYNWQMHQVGNGAASLNAKIRKEKAENEEGTVWSERSVKLADCVYRMINKIVPNYLPQSPHSLGSRGTFCSNLIKQGPFPP